MKNAFPSCAQLRQTCKRKRYERLSSKIATFVIPKTKLSSVNGNVVVVVIIRSFSNVASPPGNADCVNQVLSRSAAAADTITCSTLLLYTIVLLLLIFSSAPFFAKPV